MGLFISQYVCHCMLILYPGILLKACINLKSFHCAREMADWLRMLAHFGED